MSEIASTEEAIGLYSREILGVQLVRRPENGVGLVVDRLGLSAQDLLERRVEEGRLAERDGGVPARPVVQESALLGGHASACDVVIDGLLDGQDAEVHFPARVLDVLGDDIGAAQQLGPDEDQRLVGVVFLPPRLAADIGHGARLFPARWVGYEPSSR